MTARFAIRAAASVPRMIERPRQGNAGVAGLVLAGDLSSRFGSEKAIALLGGTPLLTRVASTLRECCEAVAVSAPSEGVAAVLACSFGAPVLSDDRGHPRGPLAGLVAGLSWARASGFDRLISLPCDTPLVGKSELMVLLARLGDRAAAYAASDQGARPLCAVWRTNLISILAKRMAAGEHPAVRGFLGEIGAAEVRFQYARPFRNANTPDVLAALQQECSTP